MGAGKSPEKLERSDSKDKSQTAFDRDKTGLAQARSVTVTREGERSREIRPRTDRCRCTANDNEAHARRWSRSRRPPERRRILNVILIIGTWPRTPGAAGIRGRGSGTRRDAIPIVYDSYILVIVYDSYIHSYIVYDAIL